MRYSLSVLLLFTTLTSVAGDVQKQAARYMKKLGLDKGEMYYASKKDIALKYGKDGELDFPNNHLYNSGEYEIMAVYGERKVPMLDCFSAMVRDMNRYMNDTGGVVYTQADTRLTDEHALFKSTFEYARPVFEDGRSLVVYYPVGVPLIKKYYRDLVKQVHAYNKEGKHINLYFVLVPLK